jgi:hypothetical protein
MTNEKLANGAQGQESVPTRGPESGVVDSTRDRVVAVTQPKREVLRPKDFINEVLTPREMTLEKVREISDFFRWIFTNDWNQFAVCPPCEEELKQEIRLSAPQAFQSEEHVPLELIDDPKNLPCCPHCSKPMKWFHDPEKTRQNLQRKLLDLGDGYASLIRHPSDGKVAGFTFGYGATLRQEFEGEWQNRYLYMKEPPHKAGRDLDALIEAINQVFPNSPMGPDSKVFGWNCIALAPNARFNMLLGNMMRSLFNSIPPNERDRMIVGEAIKGSPAYRVFKTLGARDIPDYLENNETILGGPLSWAIEGVNMSPEEFAKIKRSL